MIKKDLKTSHEAYARHILQHKLKNVGYLDNFTALFEQSPAMHQYFGSTTYFQGNYPKSNKHSILEYLKIVSLPVTF